MRLRMGSSSASESAVRSRPSTNTRPDSGFSSPRISFSNSDFPEPVTPSRISVSPAPTRNDTSASTCFSSKESETPRSSMLGVEGITLFGSVVGFRLCGLVAASLCGSHTAPAERSRAWQGGRSSKESDADEELGEEEIQHQDQHGGHNHCLGRGASYTFRPAASVQTIVATYQGD